MLIQTNIYGPAVCFIGNFVYSGGGMDCPQRKVILKRNKNPRADQGYDSKDNI